MNAGQGQRQPIHDMYKVFKNAIYIKLEKCSVLSTYRPMLALSRPNPNLTLKSHECMDLV